MNNIEIDQKKVYTAKETAEILRTSTETIRKYARLSLIGYYKFSERGDYRFPGTEIMKFLKNNFYPIKNTQNIQ